jgi:hypothetical protein
MRIFVHKREEVAGGWRKLRNEELRNLYASPNIIRMIKPRRMEWVGHVAHIRDTRNAYIILMENPERKISLGRPRSTFEDKIKIYLREMGGGVEVVDWIHLAQDRDQWWALLNTVINLQVS